MGDSPALSAAPRCLVLARRHEKTWTISWSVSLVLQAASKLLKTFIPNPDPPRATQAPPSAPCTQVTLDKASDKAAMVHKVNHLQCASFSHHHPPSAIVNYFTRDPMPAHAAGNSSPPVEQLEKKKKQKKTRCRSALEGMRCAVAWRCPALPFSLDDDRPTTPQRPPRRRGMMGFDDVRLGGTAPCCSLHSATTD